MRACASLRWFCQLPGCNPFWLVILGVSDLYLVGGWEVSSTQMCEKDCVYVCMCVLGEGPQVSLRTSWEVLACRFVGEGASCLGRGRGCFMSWEQTLCWGWTVWP